MPFALVVVEGSCPVCRHNNGTLYLYIRYEPLPVIGCYIFVHDAEYCLTTRNYMTPRICSRAMWGQVAALVGASGHDDSDPLEEGHLPQSRRV